MWPEECGMAKEKDRIQSGILGDINPVPMAKDHVSGSGTGTEVGENDESMVGGSRHDRTEHSGSRDVTEGVTGGTGTEVGGTRHPRQGAVAPLRAISQRPRYARCGP